MRFSCQVSLIFAACVLIPVCATDAFQASDRLVPLPRDPGVPYSTAFRDALTAQAGSGKFLDGSPGVVPLVRDLEQSLKNSRAKKSRRLNDLRSRIDQLKDLLERDRIRRQREAMEKANQAPQTPTPPRDEAIERPGPSPEAIKLIEEAADKNEPTPVTRVDPAELLQQVSEKPIDRLKLADSLFAINELQMALDIYEKLDDSTSTTPDQVWIRYQRACTLRRLNKTDSARRYFRAVAGIDTSGFLGECSRWWLDTLDERTGLEQKVEIIQSSIEAMEKEINGGKKNPDKDTAAGKRT